jgi:hypothetical protein
MTTARLWGLGEGLVVRNRFKPNQFLDSMPTTHYDSSRN